MEVGHLRRPFIVIRCNQPVFSVSNLDLIKPGYHITHEHVTVRLSDIPKTGFSLASSKVSGLETQNFPGPPLGILEQNAC